MTVLEQFKNARNYRLAQVRIKGLEMADKHYIFFNDYAKRVELHRFEWEVTPLNKDSLALSIDYDYLLDYYQCSFIYLRNYDLWAIDFEKNTDHIYRFYCGQSTIDSLTIKSLFADYEKQLEQEHSIKAYEESLITNKPIS